MAAASPVSEAPLFLEERRPATSLLKGLRWGGLVLAVLSLAWLVYVQATWPWLLAVVLAGMLFQWWIWTTRFLVRLGPEALSLRQAPFPVRRLERDQIVGATPHMSYPWGFQGNSQRPRRTPGVEAYATSLGSGVVVELEGGHALWLNCDRAEELASLLRRPKRRARSRAAKASAPVS